MGEVTDPALLAKLNGGSAPAAPRTPQPILTLPNPHQDLQDANSVQSTQNSNTQTALAVQEAARKQAEFDATHNPDGSIRQDAGQATEDQRKSSNFYGRMLTAEAQYRSTDPGARDARTIPGQYLHDNFPGIDASLNTSDRVTSDNAARNWIAASLRQESGAAISQGEFDNQYRIFFPMPGDGPDQIRQKEIARQQAMEGFKTGAGPLSSTAEQQYHAQFGDKLPWQIGNAAPDGGSGGGNGGGGSNMPTARDITPEGTQAVFGGQADSSIGNPITSHADALKELYGITPQGEDWMVGFWNANLKNPRLTIADVRQAYRNSGLPDVQEVADRLRDSDVQERIDQAKKGVGAQRYDTSDAEKAYLKKLHDDLAAQGFDPASGAAGLDRIRQNLTGGFTDELSGAESALVNGMRGYDPIQAYKQTRDSERLKLQEEQGAQGATGYALGAVGALPSLALGGDIKTPIDAAKVGGAYGAVSGFGEGNGAQDSLISAATGGLVGAGGGAAIQKLAEPAGIVLRKVLPTADVAANRVAQGGADIAIAPVDEAQVADVAKTATGWGSKAQAAKDRLAGMFSPDPAAAASAERLGMDVPADVLSNNQQARSLAGLTRSQAGSDAETAWKADAARISEYADKALADLGGTPDLAQVSSDIFDRLNTTAQHLQDKASSLRSEVDAAIEPSARVQATNLQDVLGKTINDYGGIAEAKAAMSGPEKQMLAMLGEGETAKMPTYARLNRLRQDIGEAWSKGKGPWADVNHQQLGEYYKALQADQLGAVEQLGGAELASKQETANALFSKMYQQRNEMQDLFGKSLESSMAPLLRRAITTGGKGDAEALTTLIDRIPEDAQGGAIVSALMAQARTTAGGHGGFSFTNFAKAYRGLRENAPVFAKVAKAVGPNGTRVLNDLHVISERMVQAEANVLKTGKANQVLSSTMKAEGLVGNIMGAVASRAATGTGAVVGGAVAGPAGAAVGAHLGGAAKDAITNGGATRLDKVHALLSSPQFKAVITRVANGEDIQIAGKSLWDNIAFHNLGRSLGLLTPSQRRAWLVRLTASEASGPAGDIGAQIVQGLQSGPARIAAGGDQSQSGATPTSIPVPR